MSEEISPLLESWGTVKTGCEEQCVTTPSYCEFIAAGEGLLSWIFQDAK
jgi:hypothetical protein